MRRGTKVSGTNENPLLEGTRKRKMEDGGGREKKKEEVEGQKENTLER